MLAFYNNGKSQVVDFISALQPKDQAKISALIDLVATMGPPQNNTKFKKLDGDLYELKAYQTRIACFFASGSRFFLVLGITKKQDRWKTSDLEKAKNMKRIHDEQH